MIEKKNEKGISSTSLENLDKFIEKIEVKITNLETKISGGVTNE